ncbi:hypothetical protein BDD12DRAFT_291397 [Trichophaea hybrida]|nr:hypothetical protein BDD12DRAFT_291397 [Trichophaea hybrida]
MHYRDLRAAARVDPVYQLGYLEEQFSILTHNVDLLDRVLYRMRERAGIIRDRLEVIGRSFDPTSDMVIASSESEGVRHRRPFSAQSNEDSSSSTDRNVTTVGSAAQEPQSPDMSCFVQQPPTRSGFVEIVKTFALFGILVNLSIGLWIIHRMSNREYCTM